MDEVAVVCFFLSGKLCFEDFVPLFNDLEEKLANIELLCFVLCWDVEDLWVYLTYESENSAGVFI